VVHDPDLRQTEVERRGGDGTPTSCKGVVEEFTFRRYISGSGPAGDAPRGLQRKGRAAFAPRDEVWRTADGYQGPPPVRPHAKENTGCTSSKPRAGSPLRKRAAEADDTGFPFALSSGSLFLSASGVWSPRETKRGGGARGLKLNLLRTGLLQNTFILSSY